MPAPSCILSSLKYNYSPTKYLRSIQRPPLLSNISVWARLYRHSFNGCLMSKWISNEHLFTTGLFMEFSSSNLTRCYFKCCTVVNAHFVRRNKRLASTTPLLGTANFQSPKIPPSSQVSIVLSGWSPICCLSFVVFRSLHRPTIAASPKKPEKKKSSWTHGLDRW